MIVLALDLGSRTGWASHCDRGGISSGFVDFKNSRYEGGGMRYLRFRRWLDAFAPRPEALYFEAVRRHKGTDAAHVYGGLLATVTSWCEDHGIPYQGVPVGTIKKHATGKGNASKERMIAAANRKGLNSQDDNECDAWWLLDHVLQQEMFA